MPTPLHYLKFPLLIKWLFDLFSWTIFYLNWYFWSDVWIICLLTTHMLLHNIVFYFFFFVFYNNFVILIYSHFVLYINSMVFVVGTKSHNAQYITRQKPVIVWLFMYSKKVLRDNELPLWNLFPILFCSLCACFPLWFFSRIVYPNSALRIILMLYSPKCPFVIILLLWKQ